MMSFPSMSVPWTTSQGVEFSVKRAGLPQAKQQRFYWYAAGPTEALDGVMYIQANCDSPIQPTRSAQNISFLKQTKSSILYLPIVFWGSWYCRAS